MNTHSKILISVAVLTVAISNTLLEPGSPIAPMRKTYSAAVSVLPRAAAPMVDASRKIEGPSTAKIDSARSVEAEPLNKTAIDNVAPTGTDELSSAANEGGNSSSTQTALQPKCDIIACTSAYHSFNPSDCTYQPSDGPRRLCRKGVVPREPNNARSDTMQSNRADANSSTNGQCNVTACANAYRSFDPSDCTYQPSEGARRLCTKK
jgi:hypothetical protein